MHGRSHRPFMLACEYPCSVSILNVTSEGRHCQAQKGLVFTNDKKNSFLLVVHA